MKNPLKSQKIFALITLLLPGVFAEDWDDSTAWRYGFGASLLVSFLGFLMSLLVVLLLKFQSNKKPFVLGIFIAFAVGALLGDVFFHILPEIYATEATHHEEEGHSDEWSEEESATSAVKHVEPAIISLLALMGILAFALIEIFMSFLGISHTHGIGDDDHKDEEDVSKSEHARIQSNEDEGKPAINSHGSNKVTHNQEEGNTNGKEPVKGFWASWKNKHSVGWLNLISDFIHNIMDGLAMGVAFMSKDKNIAITTWVAVIAHEIPQELGDMGILINAKFFSWQALLCNGLINFSALIGCFIGLGIGSIDEDSEKLVLAFVAGNFIYIACADMIPQLMKEKIYWKKTIYAIVSFIAGLIMWIVGFAESGHDH